MRRACVSAVAPGMCLAISINPHAPIATIGKVRSPRLRPDLWRSQPIGSASANAMTTLSKSSSAMCQSIENVSDRNSITSIIGSGCPYEGQLLISPNHLITAAVVNNDERVLTANFSSMREANRYPFHQFYRADIAIAFQSLFDQRLHTCNLKFGVIC